MNSYGKRQVLMFYPLGKNSEKPYVGAGVASSPPPHCTSECYINIISVAFNAGFISTAEHPHNISLNSEVSSTIDSRKLSK